MDLKEYAYAAGAMGCGISSVNRFEEAPEGFRPTDIFSKCKSIVVMFRQMPAGAMLAENPIPYTHAAYMMYAELDRMSKNVMRYRQTNGVNGVIVPADVPYLHWEEANKHGRVSSH